MFTYSNNWQESTTSWTSSWSDTITSGTISENGFSYYMDVGINNTVPIRPYQEQNLDYRIGQDRFSYAEDERIDGKRVIKVDKGSPAKARYAIFYAVNKDPVIFCRTRREMYREVKKLLKRKEVDPRSIRIFALMGGAKIVKKKKE